MSDLRSDLTADLLTDLARPAPVVLPPPSGTPALTVRLTPLQWSRPSLDTPEAGLGVAVRIGPWRVEVAV